MENPGKDGGIARNFVDEDGWLTYAVSEGGKKRLTFHADCHGFRVPPTTGNEPTSDEVYAKLVEHPENVAVVLASVPEDAAPSRFSATDPYACALASACDAAGLIDKGRTIVCLTLGNYEFPVAADGSGTRYGWGYYNTNRKKDLYGHTAEKHDMVARQLVELGAELVAAPEDWDGKAPKCRLVGWKAAGRQMACEFAHVTSEGGYTRPLSSNMLPVIDADTPLLRKIAGSFAEDEGEKLRKTALARAKNVFSGLELSPEETVELLSYGRLEWEDARSKSYKVPIWKQGIIRATAERLEEFNGGQGEDACAEKIDACRLIWSANLDAYGISFKRGREAHDEIVRVWKELGATIGVDSSVEAVLEHGVPVEDVIAAAL